VEHLLTHLIVGDTLECNFKGIQKVLLSLIIKFEKMRAAASLHIVLRLLSDAYLTSRNLKSS
jgi:hypothetical protein